MSNQIITVSEFGEQADALMAKAAGILAGMRPDQADIVVQMGKMLDFASRKLGKLPDDVKSLADKAANHALAMRMHGGTMRGPAGAEMLEDLCDAATGRYFAEAKSVPKTPVKAERPAECYSIEEAMTALGVNTFTALAHQMKTTCSVVTRWKNNGGYLPISKSALVREILRTRRVAK